MMTPTPPRRLPFLAGLLLATALASFTGFSSSSDTSSAATSGELASPIKAAFSAAASSRTLLQTGEGSATPTDTEPAPTDTAATSDDAGVKGGLPGGDDAPNGLPTKEVVISPGGGADVGPGPHGSGVGTETTDGLPLAGTEPAGDTSLPAVPAENTGYTGDLPLPGGGRADDADADADTANVNDAAADAAAGGRGGGRGGGLGGRGRGGDQEPQPDPGPQPEPESEPEPKPAEPDQDRDRDRDKAIDKNTKDPGNPKVTTKDTEEDDKKEERKSEGRRVDNKKDGGGDGNNPNNRRWNNNDNNNNNGRRWNNVDDNDDDNDDDGGGGGGGGGDKGGVRKSSRRNRDKDMGVKEFRSGDDAKKWNREWQDIKRRKNSRDTRVDDRRGTRRRNKSRGYGYYERKCCFTWIKEECYFEPKPWGWYWSRRDFKRAARRSGYPWLRPGDECYDYRNRGRLRDFCYCTVDRYRSCNWVDVNQKC